MKSKQKIIFIIQGEGRGHLTQAIRLKQMLEKDGHEIISAYIGTGPDGKVPVYAAEIFRDDIYGFNSPNFLRSKNRKGILTFSSIVINLFRSISFIKSIVFLKKEINEKSPDIVINFYDMLGGLAYYFSVRRAEYFVISHHFLFESPEFIHPDNFFIQKRLLSLHNQICAMKAKQRLALSFDPQHDFGNTRITPPLIRKELLNDNNKSGGFVLVYLLHEGLSVDLLPIFRRYPDINFSLFMKPEFINHVFPSNVDISAPDNNEFVKKLLTCSVVITTSGFETICEASFLNKPVYLIPSENHYEQHGNFKDAIRAGIAASYPNFKAPDLQHQNNHKFVSWCKQSEEIFLKTILS